MLTTLPISTSCLTETWLEALGTQGRPAVVLGKPYDPGCWPGTWDLATTVSPAICPEGYTSAYEVTDSAQRGQGETVWACCPSNFVYDGGIWQCLADQGGETKTYTVTDTDSNGDTITTQVTSDKGINAHVIQVAFHSSDIFSPPTSTTQSSAQTTTSSTIASPSNSTPSSSSRALSTAASIGIGVAVGASTLIFLAIIVWLIRRRVRKRQPKPVQQYTAQLPQQPFLSDTPEIHSVNKPSELNAVPGVHELESKGNGPRSVNRPA